MHPRSPRASCSCGSTRLGGNLPHIVESAADTIAAHSPDSTVRRRALRWKIAATPLIEEASLRSDPVVATVDLWALTMQLSQYLRQGDGREAFGTLQPIALAASDTLRSLVGSVAGRMIGSGGDTLAQVVQSVQGWADRHPLRGSDLVRQSVLSSDWKALSIMETNLSGTVASVERSLLGINSRLGYLNEGMLKRVQWQTQLAAGELIPPLLEQARTAMLQDIADQGRQLSLGVDAQRSAIFAGLAGERSAVMGGITAERVALVDAIRTEREAVLEAVDAERRAAVASIDSIAQRSIDHAGLVLGRLLLRAFLAFTALVAVIALGALWLVRTRRRDVALMVIAGLAAGVSVRAEAQDSTGAIVTRRRLPRRWCSTARCSFPSGESAPIRPSGAPPTSLIGSQSSPPIVAPGGVTRHSGNTRWEHGRSWQPQAVRRALGRC